MEGLFILFLITFLLLCANWYDVVGIMMSTLNDILCLKHFSMKFKGRS